MRDYVCLTNILVTFIKAFCLDYRKEERFVFSHLAQKLLLCVLGLLLLYLSFQYPCLYTRD